MPRRVFVLKIVILFVGPLSAEEVPPAADRYGDPLPPGAVARLGTTRMRHHGAVKALAISPDGSTLLTAGNDAVVRVWDSATGRELRRLHDLAEPILALALSADGSLAAVASTTSVRLWEVQTGRQRWAISRPLRRATLAFDRTSTLLAVANPDAPRLWLLDPLSGSERPGAAPELPAFEAAALAPDGRTVAVATPTNGGTSTVEFRDLDRPNEENARIEWRRSVQHLAFLPDGRHLIIAERSGRLTLWDRPSRQRVREFELPPESTIQSLAISADGSALTAAFEYQERNRRGNIRRVNAVWDVASGRSRFEAEADGLGFPQAVLNHDGSRLALGSVEGMVTERELADGRDRLTFEAHSLAIAMIAFSPDGQTIATSSADGTIRLWDTLGRPKRVLRGHGGAVQGLAFSPDGHWLASAGGWDATFRIWNLANGTERFTARNQDDRIYSVAFSPDGGTLALAGQSRIVRFYDASSGTRILCPFAQRGGFAIFSPCGALMAVPGVRPETRDHVVRLMDLATGHERGTLGGHRTEVRAALFSPDTRLVITADGSVRVWERATARELFHFDAIEGPVGGVDLSPDGRLLAIAAADGSIRLHELITGSEVARLTAPDHIEASRSLAFSPAGELLASTCGSTALLWKHNIRGERVRPPARALCSSRLESLWTELGGADARTAYAATWELAADPERVVPFLRGKFAAVAWPSPMKFAKLISDLGDSRFAVRESAMRELARLGTWAETALREANGLSPEAGRRVQELLRRLDEPERGESLRIGRALAALERMDTADARELLREVSTLALDLPPGREAKRALERR